jgi:hypothetical protein
MTVFATIEFVFDANTTHTQRAKAKVQEVNGKYRWYLSRSLPTTHNNERDW